MAVEVVGFDMAPSPLENGTQEDSSSLQNKEHGGLDNGVKENGFVNFGSDGGEPIKGELENALDANFPKDACEEWPVPHQIHSFYFVKHRTYDDPVIKAKIEQADKEIQKMNQARIRITDQLKEKKHNRADLISQLKSLNSENRQFIAILSEKTKEIKPLQQALGKFRNPDSAGWSSGLCSSEEELNKLIDSLHYRIQHESIPLSEEKQLLREIKQLEGTREKVIANAAMRAKIQGSLGQKESIQEQVKLIGSDLDGVRKEQQAVSSKIKRLEDELKTIDADIKSLQEELDVGIQKRDQAFEKIKGFRGQLANGNSSFFKCRETIGKARNLALNKDIKALEELSHAEVEKFISMWSSDKAFKNDYEKRILQSLDTRQLSRDGRMRNPDEKRVREPEVASTPEVDTAAKTKEKRGKADSRPAIQQDHIPSRNAKKEAKKKVNGSDTNSDQDEVLEKETPEAEQPNSTPIAGNEVDAEKLKEIKREEEIMKAKQAMERKKKLAEKAAAKAAIRAQREAEKKLKEREKKAKKKAAASASTTNPEDSDDAAGKASEQEKNEANVEASALVRQMVQKENVTRYRNRTKAPDSVPKAILRRKRSSSYWVWAVAAALLVLIVVLGYINVFSK